MASGDKKFIWMTALPVGALLITFAIFYPLYLNSLSQTRTKLLNMAQAQAALIDAVSRSVGRTENHKSPVSHKKQVLNLISGFYRYTSSVGETGISIVGQRKENQIQFLVGQSKIGALSLAPVPWDSRFAEAMRRGLGGETGTMEALDYAGSRVIAAYVPVRGTDLAVVVNLDLKELQWPYLKWGSLVLVWLVLTSLFAYFMFRQRVLPLERQLKATRDLNRAIVASAREGILIVRLDGRIMTMNPGAEAMFGYSKGELLGMELGTLVPEFPWRESFKEIPTHRAPSKSQNLESIVTVGLRKDRRTFPVELSMSVTSIKEEIIITAIIRDISERVAAEEELRAGQRLLQTVIETIPHPIWMKDREERYLLVNRAHSQRFGLQPQDFIRKTLAELNIVDVENMAFQSEIDRKVMDSEEIFEVSEYLTHPSNLSNFWERIIKAPLKSETGEVIGVVGLSEDITQRKLAEMEFHKSVEFTRVLQKVAMAANEAATVEEAMHGCLGDLCRVIGWPVGHVFLTREDDPGTLVTTGIWYVEEGIDISEFQKATENTDDQRSEGMAAMVLETGRPFWVPDAFQETRIKPRRDPGASGIISGAGFPIKAGNQVVGVLEFFSMTPQSIDEHLISNMEPVGIQLGRVIERARAEKGLRESEMRFSRILDIARDAIISVDETHKIVMFNRGAEHIFGYTAEDAIGQPLEILIPKNFRKGHGQEVEKFGASLQISREMNQRGEISGLRKNGEVFPGEASISKMEIQGRKYFTVILRDVTQRKFAADALEANRRLLKTVFDSIPFPLSVKDPEGRYLIVNPHWEEVFGVKEEQAYKLRTIDLPGLGDAEKQETMALDNRLLSGREKRVVSEIARWLGDNRQREFRTHKLGFENAAGQLAGIVTLHVDVTESNHRERETRLSEQRFRKLIEGSLQGMVILRRYKPQFVNQAFANIFGYDSVDDIMAMNSMDPVLAPGELKKMTEISKEAWKKGMGQATTFETLGVRKDGKFIQLEGYYQTIDWFGEALIQITVRDISDRVQLEHQLRHAQKMEAVGQLAGGVAHDFNNILQIIHGYTELAQTKTHPDHLSQKYLARVLKAADGATTLARRLLTLNRREVIRTKILDVKRLISDLVEMMKRLIGENIELVVINGDALHNINADPAMLEQVLINLIVNARDAMPNGGQITIVTENYHSDPEVSKMNVLGLDADFICIRVRDSGSGITLEDQERLFEPFFTTKEAGKGTGLGLSMAYGIIQQHRGVIEVESQHGEGTEFRIYLPAARHEVTLDVQPETFEVYGGNETILVAEDEEEVLRLVVNLLEGQGYDVITAADGVSALEIYEQAADRIDLAILDVVMPKMGGRDLCEALRQRNPSLPILFSTGYTAETIDNDFIAAHGANLIRKPYSPKILFKAVRESLDSGPNTPS